jgi:IS4 transposase
VRFKGPEISGDFRRNYFCTVRSAGGYVDFRRLYGFTQAGAFFVTRAKVNMKYHRIYSHPADKSTGVMADQTIALDGFYRRLDYPQHLRRVRYVDPETGKRLVFLTNNFALPAETIAALYKKRWQVELFSNGLSKICASNIFSARLTTP